MREGRVRVGWRRGLPASGQRRLGVGRERRHDPPVVLAPREHFLSNAGADCRTTLDEARWMVSELAGERRVVSRRGAGVDGDEHIVRRLRGRRSRRSVGEAQSDTIRRELPLDRVDRVEHRDVRHREEARRQDVVSVQELCPGESDSIRARRRRPRRLRVRCYRRTPSPRAPRWRRSGLFSTCHFTSP